MRNLFWLTVGASFLTMQQMFSNAVNFYGKIGKAKQVSHVCSCTVINSGDKAR